MAGQIVQNCVYHIYNKKTNKVYIGQSVRYKGNRVQEHFRKNRKGDKTEARMVLENALYSDIEVRIYSAPNYGLQQQQIIDFLSYFWFAGDRLQQKTVAVAASEQSAFWTGLDNAYLREAYSQLTNGNLVDIAEILHIANAIERGEIVVNKDMGGQQTAWYVNGTSTRAFVKSDSPSRAYEIISMAKQMPLNFMQQVLDNHTSKWFTTNRWKTLVNNYKPSSNNFILNKNGVLKMVNSLIRSYISEPDTTTALKSVIIQELHANGYSFGGQDIEVEWRTSTEINKSIKELVGDVVWNQLKKKTSKKVYSLSEAQMVLNEAMQFQSNQENITIPLSAFIKPKIKTTTATSQQQSWWSFDLYNYDASLDTDEFKLETYNLFREVFLEVYDPQFYTASFGSNMFQPVGRLGQLVFQQYRYNGAADTLSTKMKNKYAEMGLVQYLRVWDTFYAQLISILVQDSWSTTTTSNDQEIWYKPTMVFETTSSGKDRVAVVARFFNSGNVYPPVSGRSFKDITIY